MHIESAVDPTCNLGLLLRRAKRSAVAVTFLPPPNADDFAEAWEVAAADAEGGDASPSRAAQISVLDGGALGAAGAAGGAAGAEAEAEADAAAAARALRLTATYRWEIELDDMGWQPQYPAINAIMTELWKQWSSEGKLDRPVSYVVPTSGRQYTVSFRTMIQTSDTGFPRRVRRKRLEFSQTPYEGKTDALHPIWQWRDSRFRWRNYAPSAERSIERAFARGQRKQYIFGGALFVDVVAMTQKNPHTHFVRPVRRLRPVLPHPSMCWVSEIDGNATFVSLQTGEVTMDHKLSPVPADLARSMQLQQVRRRDGALCLRIALLRRALLRRASLRASAQPLTPTSPALPSAAGARRKRDAALLQHRRGV